MKLQPTNNLYHQPGWFFTNERLEPLMNQRELFAEVKNVFSIGGGGDFVYSLISLYGDSFIKVHTCDARAISELTQDFKSTAIKYNGYSEIKNLLSQSSLEINLSNLIPHCTKKTQDTFLMKIKQPVTIDNLKRSKLWYRDSFWQIKKPDEYVGYLTTTDRYDRLRNNIAKIRRCTGDFFSALQDFPDNYFNLIYTSNIFDNSELQREAQSYLALIHKKLSPQGKLIMCKLTNQKKMKRIVLNNGFELAYEAVNHFSIISAIRGHYDYSYFLYLKSGASASMPQGGLLDPREM